MPATILVVEDEELVRSLAEEILSECGFHVLVAGNASEALEMVAARGAGVDLLVTDIVMPGASGSDLAQVLSRLQPDLRVLYMSGYSDSSEHQYATPDGRSAFLQKPFSADLLERTVRTILAR